MSIDEINFTLARTKSFRVSPANRGISRSPPTANRDMTLGADAPHCKLAPSARQAAYSLRLTGLH